MSSSRHTRAVVTRSRSAAALAGLLWAAGAAAADCPTAMVYWDDHGLVGGTIVTAQVAYDTTFFQTYGGGSTRIRFDRAQATLALDASSDSWFQAGARVTERFEVIGASPGTPLDLTVEYHVVAATDQACGASGCGVVCWGAVQVGTDSLSADATQIGPGYGGRDVDATLEQPLHVVAGTPFEVTFVVGYHTFFGGGGDGRATGHYGIAGLPPGARAIACPGADLTPTTHASWGALKTRYR